MGIHENTKNQNGFFVGRGLSPRLAEYEALARLVKQCRSASRTECKFEEIKAAYMAIEVWSLFVDDLVGEGNILPDKVKAEIISIGIFVIKSGAAVLSGVSGRDRLSDIEFVSGAVMKGLRGG